MTLAVLESYVPNEARRGTSRAEELRRFYERALARPRDEAIPPAPGASYVDLAKQEPPQASRMRSASTWIRRNASGERHRRAPPRSRFERRRPGVCPEHYSFVRSALPLPDGYAT